MASQGPLSPGTVANSDIGRTDWLTPSLASESENSYATCELDLGLGQPYESDALKATAFGFTVPSDATIDGVLVEIERHREATGGNVSDIETILFKDDLTPGADQYAVAQWPTSDAYASYGGATDLWGLAWTAAEINASTFGVRLRVYFIGGTAGIARVDHIRITVYYTPPTTYTLDVVSSDPDFDVAILVDPADNNSLSDGLTVFSRTYNQDTTVTLVAPALAWDGTPFTVWTVTKILEIGQVQQTLYITTLEVVMDMDTVVDAHYGDDSDWVWDGGPRVWQPDPLGIVNRTQGERRLGV